MTQRLLGIEEYARLPDDGFRTELVRGRVVREPQPGYRHGRLQMRLGQLLTDHIDQRGLDLTCVGPIGYVLEREPGTVRGPDLSVLRRSRVPSEDHAGFIEAAPDLVVEILSPSNRMAEVEEKVRDYLAAGARLVWVVDARKQAVTVHAPGLPVRILAGDQELDGADVVPGFRIALSRLFSA